MSEVTAATPKPNRTVELRMSVVQNHDDPSLDKHITIHVLDLVAFLSAVAEQVRDTPFAEFVENAQNGLGIFLSRYNDTARIEIGLKDPLKASIFNPVEPGKIETRELVLGFRDAWGTIDLVPRVPVAAPPQAEASGSGPVPLTPVPLMSLKDTLRELLKEIAAEDKGK